MHTRDRHASDFWQLLKWDANSSYLSENGPIKGESGTSRGAGNQVNVPLISNVCLITVSHKLMRRCQLGFALGSFSRSKRFGCQRGGDTGQ